ncbi:MAG: DNA polymerase I [Alphaproteobacteria bacterium]
MVNKKTLNSESRVYLIDGSTFIFRAYFAMYKAAQARGNNFTHSDGTPTGAVMAFCNMMWKLINNGIDGVFPTHTAVIFDPKGSTFRNEIYPKYKANRESAPEDLIPQFPLIHDAIRAFNLEPIIQKNFEADDLIATYTKIANSYNANVTIISGDKDLMQLVNDKTKMYDPMPGNERFIDEEAVKNKFGVMPNKVVDVQALAGDSTDNIPGVPGIGIKIAAELINEYGSLVEVLKNSEKVKQNKRRENLIEYADNARISYKLALLRQDVPIEIELEKLASLDIDPEKLIDFSNKLELTNFSEKVSRKYNISNNIEKDLKEKDLSSVNINQNPLTITDEILKIPFDSQKYIIIKEEKELEDYIEKIRSSGIVSINLETSSQDLLTTEIVGLSLSYKVGSAVYIPLNHISTDLVFDLKVANQIKEDFALKILKEMIQDSSILKIGHNIKNSFILLLEKNIKINSLDDIMLMSYVLNSGTEMHNLTDLAKKYLDFNITNEKDLIGSGKSTISFNKISIEDASSYSNQKTDCMLRLWKILNNQMFVEKMIPVYDTLEKPLIPILSQMYISGILVDQNILKKLSEKFTLSIKKLENSIFIESGKEFNIGSPKQLGEILFEKMNLDGGKKTKTGSWATGADILENISLLGHPIANHVLEWRQLSKLKTTYTDALPKYINNKTNRLHTSFSLASTSTGRLSSSNPNLQNIPIRTKEGRLIRSAFISKSKNCLISADYSQIELRILAHIADIASLKKAFSDDLDIHAITASEIFNIPLENMDSETRQKAKAINFGIIYGISAFGLANQLSISRVESQKYIESYFKKFPGIQDYMDKTKEYAHKFGFVETIFGRKCHYQDINSKNHAIRSFTERAAINAPIQGSAADIIRRAMININNVFLDKNINTKMLLSVHDELIFECPDNEAEEVKELIKYTMEAAAEPIIKLSVPIKVDIKVSTNWDEAH